MKILLYSLLAFTVHARMNEYIPIDKTLYDKKIWHYPLLDYDYSFPKHWNWGDINGTNYLTKNLNQHIPQYCGSCWAHGTLSALADRIKIMRRLKGPDINLAIQYLLNCGNAGTCNGGNHLAAYKYIHDTGIIPYDTCLSYEACSDDSDEQACVNRNFECKSENICRTCDTFTQDGGKCVGVTKYPNASISSYGFISGIEKMKKEIYKNGPIACGINAEEILDYQGGVLDKPFALKIINHIISIVGWGHDSVTNTEYWIIRNSWGEYWGERGFLRLTAGENQLGIEKECTWAIPNVWTETNYPCYENGENCS